MDGGDVLTFKYDVEAYREVLISHTGLIIGVSAGALVLW